MKPATPVAAIAIGARCPNDGINNPIALIPRPVIPAIPNPVIILEVNLSVTFFLEAFSSSDKCGLISSDILLLLANIANPIPAAPARSGAISPPAPVIAPTIFPPNNAAPPPTITTFLTTSASLPLASSSCSMFVNALERPSKVFISCFCLSINSLNCLCFSFSEEVA